MVNLLTLEVKEFFGLIANASEFRRIRRMGYEIFGKLHYIECISLKLFLKSEKKQADTFIEQLSAEKVCNQTCHY